MQIWHEIRRASPALREPGIQVFSVPFPVVPTIREQGLRGVDVPAMWDRWHTLLPRNSSGWPDLSWIRPPFEAFAVVSQRSEEGAIFITAADGTTLSRMGGVWQEDATWALQADLIVRGDTCPFVLMPPCHLACKPSGSGLQPVFEDTAARIKHARERAAEFGLGFSPGDSDRSHALGSFSTLAADESDDGFSRGILAVAIGLMALLSCKNVQTVSKTPVRQQRKRDKREGLPALSWHELELVPHATSQHATPGAGEPLALHWVRGHFKDYRDVGLFGKIKGVFWWSPHVAGRADRVVLKDYKVPPLLASPPGPGG